MDTKRRIIIDRRSSPGQSMVEFVLVFPVFLLIVLGIFEFGWLLVNYTSVYAAAREGARFGAAVENLCKVGIEAQAEKAGFLAGDLLVTTKYQVYNNSLQLMSTNCSDAKVGDQVTVTVEKDYEPITGYIIGLIEPVHLKSQVSRTIVKEAYLSWTLEAPSTHVPDASTPTPTIEVTSTPGGPTETPTEAPPTPMPGVCDGTITWTATESKDSKATFINNSGHNYVLSQVIVTWDDSKPLLNEVIYFSNPSYDPIVSLALTSPASVSIPEPGWVVGTGPNIFEFIFSHKASFTGIKLIMEDVDGSTCEVH